MPSIRVLHDSSSNCYTVNLQEVDINNDGIPDNIQAQYCSENEECLFENDVGVEAICSMAVIEPAELRVQLSRRAAKFSDYLGVFHDAKTGLQILVTTDKGDGAAARLKGPLIHPGDTVTLPNGKKRVVDDLVFKLRRNMTLEGIYVVFHSDKKEIPLAKVKK